ncbi:glycosyltransferase family 2 protein [Flavobacterium sp. LB2P84]|uniref:glycosyltransferase family 2 protein n=1 Tax=Flavobacterium yafengii TaxID=3041253 RepID=UPI0024A8A72B|nr:glycosyltransferase family 2 protein [Flavobacterium yafengii]MDI6034171.1 glycosyltransferase family 2 protein [Flavobacterium yafengii]
MPKLSIITINYNNLEGLKRTLESVVNQTLQEFEYIVIDGGSTDGSLAYIESQNANIDYWISEPDTGIYNAMNKGIVKANGEYLLFLNSGDHFYNNEVLEESSLYFNSHDLICFDVHMIKNGNSRTVKHPDKLRFSDFYLNGLNHQSVLIRKELFETVGLYDENLKIVSDWKFFILALFVHNCSYININKTLSTYYLDGISAQLIEGHLNERNQVLKEYFSAFVLDYEEWQINRKLLEMNRFKMLREIEKSVFGKKMVSIFLRTFIVLFSKIRLKELLG